MSLYRTIPRTAAVITTPIADFYLTPHRITSLGTEIVAAILRRMTITVEEFHGARECTRQQLPLPKPLAYLKPHILQGEKGKCSFFSAFYHFGTPFEVLAENIGAYNPSICFISCFAFCYAEPTLLLAAAIKKTLPGVPIAIGGAGVTVHPAYFLRSPHIDFTLSGEAEIALPSFINYFFDGSKTIEQVPGLRYRTTTPSSTVQFTPIRHTLAHEIEPAIACAEESSQRITFTTSLSRGCPSSCKFCSNHLCHGRPFRHLSLATFSQSLDTLLPRATNKKVTINFEDDNLLAEYSFFMNLITLCKERFPAVTFRAENGIDYRLLTKERCDELMNAGFAQFNLTLGSVVPSTLSQEHRSHNLDRYEMVVARARQRNIPTITYIICGFPHDTKSTIAANLHYLKQQPTRIGISLFYPIPGITGFEDISQFDCRPPLLGMGSAAFPWSTTVSTATLITAFRLARFINLVHESSPSDAERELIEKTIRTKTLHTFLMDGSCKYLKLIEVPHQDKELVGMVL